MATLEDFTYFTVILLIGLAGWFFLSSLLGRIEERRAERIRKLKRTDAIRTQPPGFEGEQQVREKALENLGSRFSIIRRTFLTLLFLIALAVASAPFLRGVPIGVLSIFGAAGAVLVGIATRPFLENVIAGYVVTFSKQFRVGDTILMDDHYGTIEDVTPTHTIVKLWDWRRYIVPNSSMLTKEVLNYSNRDGLLWAKLEFHVAYDADLDRVKEISVEAAKSSQYLAGKEDPQFWIMGMEQQAVKCWLAMWTLSAADAWSIRVEVAGKIIKELDRRGIRTHHFDVRGEDGQGGKADPLRS